VLWQAIEDGMAFMVVWARSIRIICPHFYRLNTRYSLPFSTLTSCLEK